ncbi:MAG: YVTN family beta-propeller protein [Crocinitomicaceae bacterium]|jgi:YVTN family beta-propeller protein
MRLISFIVIGLVLFSCKKDEPQAPATAPDLANGALVLCEGLFQLNNSSISWIDFSSGVIDNSYFVTRTNRQIGDTGNDMKRYGSKIYVVVNVSSVIEVLSASDFTSIKQIQMESGGVSKQPRSIAFYGGNAYVTCYDGFVDVIDTSSLTVTSRIPVGNNPEGLAVANGKLYVANSGGLNFPNLDSTLSVIDLATNAELMKITVGINPGEVVSDASGDVYVISRGDYGAVPSRLKRVNSTTDVLAESFAFDINGISPMNSNFLVFDANSVSVFNAISEMIESSNFIDLSEVVTLYNISYNSFNGKIYISDAMNYTNTGYLRKYNSVGVYETSYHVGLNPKKVLFYD